jgi:hypothetical protein
VTNNAVKRLAQLGERERICGRPVENQIGVAIRFKNIPDQFPNTARPCVIAIGNGCTVIGLFQRRQHFGTNRRSVVAREFVMFVPRVHVDLANRVHATPQTTTPLKGEIA